MMKRVASVLVIAGAALFTATHFRVGSDLESVLIDRMTVRLGESGYEDHGTSVTLALG